MTIHEAVGLGSGVRVEVDGVKGVGWAKGAAIFIFFIKAIIV